MGVKRISNMMLCREASEMMGCSQAVVREMFLAGELKGVLQPMRTQKGRASRWIWIDRESVEDWCTNPKRERERQLLAERVARQAERNRAAKEKTRKAEIPSLDGKEEKIPVVSEAPTRVELPRVENGTGLAVNLGVLRAQIDSLLQYILDGGNPAMIAEALSFHASELDALASHPRR